MKLYETPKWPKKFHKVSKSFIIFIKFYEDDALGGIAEVVSTVVDVPDEIPFSMLNQIHRFLPSASSS